MKRLVALNIRPAALFVVIALLLAAVPVWSQTDYFAVDVDDLFGLWYGESDWGDFDNDNDLDLLMAGYGLVTGQGYNKFYRNDGNSVFTLLTTDLLGTGNGTVRFADLDGDGDLDALVCGQVASNVDTTRVYVNNSGVFADSGTTLPRRVSSWMSVGDYDNDGDLDILLTGGTIDAPSVGYVHILRNDGAFQFTPVEVLTPGIRNGNAEFGDYNGDGWLDIALTGSAGSGNYISKILRGSPEGTFTDIDAGLYGLRYSRIAWVDYDCDGDLDVILSGSYSNEAPSLFRLYRNDGGDTFTEVTQSNVQGERQGDLVWGDINNDGYADIIVNGLLTNTSIVENLYLYNTQTGFYENTQTLTYLKYAAISLGDYDNDNRLDMSASGYYDYQVYWNKLYHNIGVTANTPPTPPSGLNEVVSDNIVTLGWDPGSDAQTPAAGLTYNVRIGTTPGGHEVLPAMANSATGWRKVARPGNAWQRNFYHLPDLPNGVYYWSVQAIDNAFAGSAFATERSFTVGTANEDQVLSPISGISARPNPFAGEIRISVALKNPTEFDARIYNLKGQLVKTLDAESANPTDDLVWNGFDDQGHRLPAGIYLLRVQSGDQIQTRKIMKIQ